MNDDEMGHALICNQFFSYGMFVTCSLYLNVCFSGRHKAKTSAVHFLSKESILIYDPEIPSTSWCSSHIQIAFIPIVKQYVLLCDHGSTS